MHSFCTRSFSLSRVLRSHTFSTRIDPKLQAAYERDGISALDSRPSVGSTTFDRGDVLWLRQNVTIPSRSEEVLLRRSEISDVVATHKVDSPFHVEYTEDEHDTWQHMYGRLRPIWDAHASPEYLHNLANFEGAIEGLSHGAPNLGQVSSWLSGRSGFSLAPTANLIKARSFLSALAMRVFFCCAPIRPKSELNLSQEPDMVHDVLGHCPLLADADFADMSQEIGLMALHANEDEMHKLTMLHWHFVEFGVNANKDDPQGVKMSGAAILSSEGEIGHVMSNKANIKTYSHSAAFGSTYDPITSDYQAVYLKTNDVKEARDHVFDCINSGDFKRTPGQLRQIDGLRTKYSNPNRPSSFSGRRHFSSSRSKPGSEDAPGGNDWEEFRTNGKQMIDFIADYYESIEQHPVRSQVKPGYLQDLLPKRAPETPESLDAVLADVKDKIHPGVTHWQHPKFFAYFPTAVSPHSLLGDMLSGMYSVVAFSWVASPASTELETITMDWLGKMCNLPESFLSTGKGGGVVQGSASEATLVALLAAKARALKELKPEGESEADFMARAVCYSSDQAHSSIKKALMIAGFNMDLFDPLPTERESGYAASGEVLAARIAEDKVKGLVPVFMCSNTGTTNTCAMDPIDQIGPVCQEHNVYFHVDAAYAGSAAICPEHQNMFEGLELADSMAFNPHKWMLVNFDFCAMWVKDRAPVVEALSITPAYLRSKEHDEGLVSDYRDWQVPLGRRFRSLKLWTTLRMYGAEKLRSHIRKGISMGDAFADRVLANDRFEMSAPHNLGLVCFRLKGSNELNRQLLDNINATGETFLISTELDGAVVLRFVGGNLMSTMKDMEEVWSLVVDEAEKLLVENEGSCA